MTRRRVLLAGAVLLACVAAMELSLQGAGVVVRAFVARRGSVAARTGSVTILCVGDSHTFGLPLPAEESYPAQLEVALRRAQPQHEFRVANLGIPSVNSAWVANRLERQLFQLQPQLVIVWVGINNRWNAVEAGRNRQGSRLHRALLHSKLFRLATIAWYGATGHQYDPAQRGAWHAGEGAPSGRSEELAEAADPAPGLAEDFARMQALTRTLDVPILFVGYPLPAQQALSARIAQIGERLGVTVIDTAASLARARADGHDRSELVDERAGPHPSRLLYTYVVEDMLPEVLATLAAWE